MGARSSSGISLVNDVARQTAEAIAAFVLDYVELDEVSMGAKAC